MRDFIIVAPQYTHTSNGIKTLHKICHSINQLGGRARMIFILSNSPECQDLGFRDASWTNPEWNTPPLQESEQKLFKTAYVIYPEVIIGNPLKAPHVIRYFGNREGYCNNMMINLHPNDFLLAHSRATRKEAHCILFNSEINPLFNNSDTIPTLHRSVDLTYVGKGYIYGEVALIKNTVIINREWPPQQEQLATLLRGTRIFYTWDAWTQLNVEAIFCGAVPCLLRYTPWTEDDLDNNETGRIPRVDMNHQHIDIEKFNVERLALIERFKALSASWDQRVKNFMEQAESYFSAKGA